MGIRIMKNNKNKLPCLFSVIIMLMSLIGVVVCNIDPCQEVIATDNDIIEFAMNIQYLSGEIFSCGASGKGLDSIDPSLSAGGPPPLGCQMANLDPRSRRIVQEFAYEEAGQIRVTRGLYLGSAPPRPSLDLGKKVIADIFEAAIGHPLIPPFDAYANSINFFLTLSIITYNGLTGLTGASPALAFLNDRLIFSKIQTIEGGQNAFFREMLSERANQLVVPYNITVAEFTNRTSELANRLGKCGLKDEGIEVPLSLGAENRTESNLLAADYNSLAYTRTSRELLRILYGSGNEGVPGSYFPKGFNGNIARRFIGKNN